MGLFGFGKKKNAPVQVQQQQQQPMPQIMIAPWQTKPVTKTYRLPSEHEAVIYTYDGTALKGIPSNSKFVITAVPADVRLVSIYTGNVATTTDYGDIAYEYNGQIFGFSSSHAEAVKKMMMNGYRVEVEAYITGYDGQLGFPKVKGLFGFVEDSVYNAL